MDAERLTQHLSTFMYAMEPIQAPFKSLRVDNIIGILKELLNLLGN